MVDPHDEIWFDEAAGPVVRFYTVTGGRTRPSATGFDLVAFVVTVISLGRRLPQAAGAAVTLLLLAASEAIVAFRWGIPNPTNLLFSAVGTAALYGLVVTIGASLQNA